MITRIQNLNWKKVYHWSSNLINQADLPYTKQETIDDMVVNSVVKKIILYPLANLNPSYVNIDFYEDDILHSLISSNALNTHMANVDRGFGKMFNAENQAIEIPVYTKINGHFKIDCIGQFIATDLQYPQCLVEIILEKVQG